MVSAQAAAPGCLRGAYPEGLGRSCKTIPDRGATRSYCQRLSASPSYISAQRRKDTDGFASATAVKGQPRLQWAAGGAAITSMASAAKAVMSRKYCSRSGRTDLPASPESEPAGAGQLLVQHRDAVEQADQNLGAAVRNADPPCPCETSWWKSTVRLTELTEQRRRPRRIKHTGASAGQALG